MIVAHALTEPTVDTATIGIDLMETVDDEIARVTADAAYETVAFYAAAEMRDATVVVPPSKTARVSVSNSSSGRRWKLDHAPAVGDPTHMVEFGTGRRAFAREA